MIFSFSCAKYDDDDKFVSWHRRVVEALAVSCVWICDGRGAWWKSGWDMCSSSSGNLDAGSRSSSVRGSIGKLQWNEAYTCLSYARKISWRCFSWRSIACRCMSSRCWSRRRLCWRSMSIRASAALLSSSINVCRAFLRDQSIRYSKKKRRTSSRQRCNDSLTSNKLDRIFGSMNEGKRQSTTQRLTNGGSQILITRCICDQRCWGYQLIRLDVEGLRVLWVDRVRSIAGIH